MPSDPKQLEHTIRWKVYDLIYGQKCTKFIMLYEDLVVATHTPLSPRRIVNTLIKSAVCYVISTNELN